MIQKWAIAATRVDTNEVVFWNNPNVWRPNWGWAESMNEALERASGLKVNPNELKDLRIQLVEIRL